MTDDQKPGIPMGYPEAWRPAPPGDDNWRETYRLHAERREREIGRLRAESAALREALQAMVDAIDAGNSDRIATSEYLRQVKRAEAMARAALSAAPAASAGYAQGVEDAAKIADRGG